VSVKPGEVHFDETCKAHNHTGNLPCPWPNCPQGISEEGFNAITPVTNEERQFTRKSWRALNGDERFSWDDTTFFSYFGVKQMIRKEMLRIFGPKPYFRGLIYHYTSIRSFFDIIKSKDLWLTDYRYMNDASEINHGIDLSREILDKFTKEKMYEGKKEIIYKWQNVIQNNLFDRICIACFSSEKDSLSQWRGYGGAAIGICLGLSLEGDFFGRDTQARLNRVVYDQKEQMEILKNLFHIFLVISDWDKGKVIRDIKGNIIDHENKDNLVTEYAIRDLYEYIVYFKNHSFADEREVRWVYTEDRKLHDDLQTPYSDKFFRCKNNQIIPYTTSRSLFNVNFSNRYGDKKEKSPLPLREVVIGPQENMDLVLKGVREFLDENCYTSVEVTKSDIPYRPSG